MAWPIPAITDETRAFWTGGADGRLMITPLRGLRIPHAPAGSPLPGCLSENVAPSPVSGRGTVYSFTINRRSGPPGSRYPT